MDSGLRSLSATAEEETELLQISRDAVFNIFKKDPKVLMNLVSEIVRRMRKQDEEMVGQLKSREKVLENLVAERTAQLEEKNEALKNALVTLQSTQKQLVLKEKLATLNEISAEIAHEIQNPLNFVNNFSEINMELSNEILAGLNEVTLPDDVLADFNDILRNNQAIAEHGKRASNIVSKLLKQARKAEALKSMPVV